VLLLTDVPETTLCDDRLDLVDTGADGVFFSVVASGPFAIQLDELGPFTGHGVLGEDRTDGALGFTCAAVDALIRVDIQLAIQPI
jgi:hypothetical protein